MQVAGIQALSGDVVTMELHDPRALGSEEVLIDVRAAGVGNWDEIVRTGGWDIGVQAPMALGVEAAGVITAVGAAVTRFGVGDPVLCHPVPIRDQGCWSPLLIAPEASLALKPANMPWDIAGVFPIPALTAEQVLTEALALRSGETLLVHGAGGATGGMIVQLAAHLGAHVIATCSPGSADRVRSYGAYMVLDYHDQSWPQRVRALLNGEGVNAAANATVGGAASSMTAVAGGGRLATITSDPPAADRDISVTNVYVRSDGAQLTRLATLFAGNKLSMPSPARYGIDDAATALARVVAGQAKDGSVITL